MSNNRANIESPDVIKELRFKLIKFDEVARQAVGGCQGDVHRVVHWVIHEQASFWKQELRKSEDLYQQARSKYTQAKDPNSPYRKDSSVDERVEMQNAKRRRDEAEVKLAKVKRWTTVVGRETEELLGPVRVFAGSLEAFTPKAIAQLDLLIDRLEDYLRTRGPDSPTQ